MSEIEWIVKNNPVEISLHYIVRYFIESAVGDKYIITDVSSRRRTKKNVTFDFSSITGFPDLVLFEKSNELPICSVEIKYLPFRNGLSFIKNKDQLKGHALKYGLALFTNGLEWSLLDSNDKIIFSITLGEYIKEQNKIKWCAEINFEKLTKKLEQIVK